MEGFELRRKHAGPSAWLGNQADQLCRDRHSERSEESLLDRSPGEIPHCADSVRNDVNQQSW